MPQCVSDELLQLCYHVLVHSLWAFVKKIDETDHLDELAVYTFATYFLCHKENQTYEKFIPLLPIFEVLSLSLSHAIMFQKHCL